VPGHGDDQISIVGSAIQTPRSAIYRDPRPARSAPAGRKGRPSGEAGFHGRKASSVLLTLLVVAARAAGVELAAVGVPLETLPFRGEAQHQK
jgi:hypothetical protein